ncbi:CapA family protein [Ureibacillus composti]|nr:CapA family protein [Ureibacillus composti]
MSDSYKPPLVYEVTNKTKIELSIFFAGDTLLGDAAEKLIKQKGYLFPFRYLNAIYQKADVRTINLEAPICDKAEKLKAEKDYKYKMSSEVLSAFTRKKINIFHLANNHTLDYGKDGLLETIELLEDREKVFLGAGRNLNEATRGVIVKKGEIKVGLLNYMSYRKSYQEKYNYFASNQNCGVAAFSEKRVKEDINRLKELGANHIVVSIHWGINYKPVTKKQKKQAKIIADAGASVIIGHGSHQFQKISQIGSVPVFYSLGNFIFTTPGRSPLTYGFPVTLHFNENSLDHIEIWPITTNNRIIKFQPRHLSGSKASDAFRDLFEQSDIENLKIEVTNEKALIYFK